MAEREEPGILQQTRRGMARCTVILLIGVVAYWLTTIYFGDLFGLTALAAGIVAAMACLSDGNKRFICPHCRKPILRSIREGAEWFDTRNQLWEMRLLLLGPRTPDYCPRCRKRLN